MLGTIKTTAAWVRNLFSPPPLNAPRRPVKFRPRVESLEAREVPASLTWTGEVDSVFETAANWRHTATGVVATQSPAAGDDLAYGYSFGYGDPETVILTYDRDCYGLRDLGGAYASVTISSGYAATVTVTSEFTTGSLTLGSGTIDQPAPGGSYTSTDITVTDSFSWTGGTLNSTSHLATLVLDGATGTFAPASGGTVELGSSVSLENGAEANLYEGTIEVQNEDTEFAVGADAEMKVLPGQGKKAEIKSSLTDPTGNPVIEVETGGYLTVVSGMLDHTGRCENSGTVTISAGSTAKFSGIAQMTAYLQQAGVTNLYGGAALVDGGLGLSGVVIAGGKFVAKSSGGNSSDPVATIYAAKGVWITGTAEVSITAASGFFGTLKIEGDVQWDGGTFKPRVRAYTLPEQVGESPSDRLQIVGKLDISQAARIEPVPLDSDGAETTAQQDNYWLLIEASGGLTIANNTQELYDPALWSGFTNVGLTRYFLRAR